MKKFLVPVSYVVWGRVEVESESIEKLRDDIRHNRIYVPLPSIDDVDCIDGSDEVDVDASIIDVETDEEYGW